MATAAPTGSPAAEVSRHGRDAAESREGRVILGAVPRGAPGGGHVTRGGAGAGRRPVNKARAEGTAVVPRGRPGLGRGSSRKGPFIVPVSPPPPMPSRARRPGVGIGTPGAPEPGSPGRPRNRRAEAAAPAAWFLPRP